MNKIYIFLFIFVFTISSHASMNSINNEQSGDCWGIAMGYVEWEGTNYGWDNEAQMIQAFADWYNMCQQMNY